MKMERMRYFVDGVARVKEKLCYVIHVRKAFVHVVFDLTLERRKYSVLPIYQIDGVALSVLPNSYVIYSLKKAGTKKTKV
jgi:hypothetical protein